jgi:hypothetical protein
VSLVLQGLDAYLGPAPPELSLPEVCGDIQLKWQLTKHIAFFLCLAGWDMACIQGIRFDVLPEVTHLMGSILPPGGPPLAVTCTELILSCA